MKKRTDKNRKNRHHLTPVSLNGGDDPENLLLLKVSRHQALHVAFRKRNGKERSLEEIIVLLVRVHRIKGRCLYAAMGRPCNLSVCFNPHVSTPVLPFLKATRAGSPFRSLRPSTSRERSTL